MRAKRKPMRYAHLNGHTNCTYSSNGDQIITCGTDGDIRIWQGIDDDDPSSKCLGEFVTCLYQYETRLLVSTDLNTVQAHTFPEMDRDGTELRFTATVTCLCANEEYVAAGSEDTDIRVFRKDKSGTDFQLQGHAGPVLAVDVSSDHTLASCSGDGTLKIWNLGEKKCVKTISGLPKCTSFEKVEYLGTPSFSPNGKSLAYANGKEIVILNTATWEVQFTLTDEEVKGNYSCCKFSLDGQYVAAGTDKGELTVWDFTKKKSYNPQASSVDELNRITVIVWNPKQNGEFAYCDAAGQLGTVTGCSLSKSNEDDDGQTDFFDDMAVDEDMESDFGGVHFENDGYDDDNGISLEKLKNDTMRANGVDIDDEDTKASLKSYRSTSLEPKQAYVKTFKQQKAFQPSSTPSDLEHRYLVWNEIGIVRAHTDDNDGSIDIEFHDVSTHHNLHMTNYNNHTMASLSPSVLALSGESSSKLVCISLAASSSKEWSVDLPDCEGVVALVATNKLVAVGTDNRFVRIFSVLGTQREVISIPGPILAMTGRDDKIMVCFHSAPAYEDQHVSAILIQAFGMTLRTREIRIPIPAEKKMTWLGYSDQGSPVFSDTMGLVQMYSVKSNCWYPICDMMKHAQSVSNNFFIIDVSEKNQLLHAVLCRGSSYPMTTPRPMVMELPMQIPVADIESEKSSLEESLMRFCTFQVENSEKQTKETALKLFALSCRSEMEARAKELIEMIASPTLLPLAVKYASKLGRIHLADKLSELLPQIEEQHNEREREMRNIESDALSIIQSSPLNASILLMQRNSSKADSTPKLAPKPMVLSNQKRNPFKRSSAMGTPTTPKDNPFSHLMDKAIEMRSTPTQPSYDDNDSVIQDSQPVANENVSNNNENIPKQSFVSWYSQNKADLAKQNPDATPGELTKIGMKEFKTIGGSRKDEHVSAKRKLDEDGSMPAEKTAFTAKLAKFDFKK